MVSAGLIVTETQAQKLQLNEAIAEALKANYNVQEIKLIQQQAKVNNGVGAAGELPSVVANVNESWAINNQRQEFANPNQEPIDRRGAMNNNFSANVVATYTLFDGFRVQVARERLKSLELQAADATRLAMEALVTNLTLTYLNLQEQTQKVSLFEKNLRISEDRVKLAKDRNSAGTGSPLEVLNAEVDRNQDQAILQNQLALVQQATAQLNLLLQRKPEAATQVTAEIFKADTISYNRAVEKLQERNPRLAQTRRQIELAQQAYKTALSERYPRVILNGGYAFNNNFNQAGFIRSNTANGFNVGVGASYNLFDGNRVNRNLELSRLDQQQANIQVKNTEANETNSLYQAYLEVRNASSLRKLEETNVGTARKNADVAQYRYQAGLATPLEVREAQRNALAAELRLLEADFRLAQSLNNIRFLTGGE